MSDLIPGTEVEARGLRWQVVRIEEQAGSRVCRLRGLGSIAAGVEIELLLGLEQVAAIRHEVDPAKAGRLREWLLYHQAFLLEQALGPRALLAAQPGRLEIQSYQLVPVVRALAMSRVRLLLADGVGLGKTIQAGLVLAELQRRQASLRALVICPANLRRQWAEEIEARFGLQCRTADQETLTAVAQSSAVGQSPCRRASRVCAVAPTATATASAATQATAHRRFGRSTPTTEAAAIAVAVVASTRYSTEVALSHRLAANSAIADATIQLVALCLSLIPHHLHARDASRRCGRTKSSRRSRWTRD